MSQSAKTLLAKLPLATQEEVKKLGIMPAPKEYEHEPAIWVAEMPTLPVGVVPKFRWIETSYDDETVHLFNEWRKRHYPEYVDTEKCPVPHNTVIFNHNPLDVNGKAELLKSMPKGPFKFTSVRALGPPGKENCWVAFTDDQRIFNWMSDAQNNPVLSSNHPDHAVVEGGWPADEMRLTIIPHGTLIRNIDLDISNPPDLGPLKVHEFTFKHLDEWVGFTINGEKIKFAKRHF